MSLRVEGQITFFYYRNLAAAERFYHNTMGFEKVIDLDFAKVFRMTGGANVGIVGEGGFLKPGKEKPVMLTVMVEDADAWYSKLSKIGVNVNHPPQQQEYLNMRSFLTWDPEGYVIEILEFRKKPYGN
jgi:lactoylglutathione lyase